MATFPSTMKEFIDITYNPRKVDERRKMWESWEDGTWFARADTLTTDSNIRQVIYGAPAFNWLNYESNLWSLIPKRPAPEKLGFRILQAGGATTSTGTSGTYAQGMFETDNIASTVNATFALMRYTMKWMDVSFGISEKALFQAQRDDSLDVWAEKREHASKWHVRQIDNHLARNVNWTTRCTVLIETLDSMISSSAEATFLPSGSFNSYSGATAANIYRGYGINILRSGYAGGGYGNGPYDAVVDENAGALRSFSLDLLDGVIDQVQINGGPGVLKNLIIVTGQDTARLISKKLEARQRFLDSTRITVGLNGVQRTSETGIAAGFEVLSYQGVPILTSTSLWNNRASEGLASPAGGYTPIYGIDLASCYISVGMPTLYLETDRSHWLLLDKLRKKAGFFTAAELVFQRWNTSFKIRDLTA